LFTEQWLGNWRTLVKAQPPLKPAPKSAVEDANLGGKRERVVLVLAQFVHLYGVVAV
jgi:hypothetical protein